MTQTEILTLIAALLVGVERMLSSDQSWFPTLSGKWRAVVVSATGIPIALLTMVLGGSDWQTAVYQTLLTVVVPTLLALLSIIGGSKQQPVPNALDEAKAAAAKLGKIGLVLTVLALTGCAGSLETARLESVAGVRLATATTQIRCEQLDDRRIYAFATAETAGVLGGVAGLGTIWTRDDNLETGLQIGAVTAAGVAAGATVVGVMTDQTWVMECAK